MRPRQDLAELFSTFLQLETGTSGRWSHEPALRRSILRALQLHPTQATQATQAFWVRYWLEQHRQQHSFPSSASALSAPTSSVHRLSQHHLLAYTQEACYWASYRFHKTMAQFAAISDQTLADYFQIAQAQFSKVLAGFSPDRGATLETYAELAFTHRLKDAVRQQKTLDICSNWSLLRRTSRKQLQETLEHQSLSPALQQPYLWAWLCFREGWIGASAPGARRRLAPATEDWQAIAQSYNQSKPPEQPLATPEQLEQRLTQMAAWLRAYLHPSVQSLNQLQYGEEGEERLAGLSDPTAWAQSEGFVGSPSLLTNLIAEEEINERQRQRSQLDQVLAQAIQTLKPEWQTVLDLYYRQGLIQSQIAKHLGCSQPSVARYLLRAREALLNALVTWSQQTLNIVSSPDRIAQQGDAMEEWLMGHYGSQSRE